MLSPASAPSSRAAVPTRPAAPCTSTVSPRFTRAVRCSIWYAVMYGKMRLTTSAGSRSSGTSTAYASGTQTRSASAPHTVSAPIRSPSSQPRAAGTEFLDDADEFVARRERRLRAAEVRPGADERVGERHPGGQHPDADLALPRPGIGLVHHLQHLGTAIVVDNHALHRPHLPVRAAPPPDRCS